MRYTGQYVDYDDNVWESTHDVKSDPLEEDGQLLYDELFRLELIVHGEDDFELDDYWPEEVSPWFKDGQRVSKDEIDKALDKDEPGLYGYGLDAFLD